MTRRAAMPNGPKHLSRGQYALGLVACVAASFFVFFATLPLLESRLPEPFPDGSDPVYDGIDLAFAFMSVFGLFVWMALFSLVFFLFASWHQRRVTSEQWKIETLLRTKREQETQARIAAAKDPGQI